MPPIRRVRQHVNPLSSKYAIPAEAPDWREVFTNPRLPLHLDIGCGKGDFVRKMAGQISDWNFLGLEIRAPLVERALIRRDRASSPAISADSPNSFSAATVNSTPSNAPSSTPSSTPANVQQNLHFVFCNANNSLRPLLADWPGGCPLQRVSIQFPDPWFKKRHQKRRVVQPELVAVLAALMPPGAWVWLQSDIEALCVAMCDRFDENPVFTRTDPNWLANSPFPAQTDRELVSAAKGLPVYRAKYVRQG